MPRRPGRISRKRILCAIALRTLVTFPEGSCVVVTKRSRDLCDRIKDIYQHCSVLFGRGNGQPDVAGSQGAGRERRSAARSAAACRLLPITCIGPANGASPAVITSLTLLADSPSACETAGSTVAPPGNPSTRRLNRLLEPLQSLDCDRQLELLAGSYRKCVAAE